MTILMSFLFLSLASCGAALWVLLHRNSGQHHNGNHQHLDPM
jgi:hypothetical protein